MTTWTVVRNFTLLVNGRRGCFLPGMKIKGSIIARKGKLCTIKTSAGDVLECVRLDCIQQDCISVKFDEPITVYAGQTLHLETKHTHDEVELVRAYVSNMTWAGLAERIALMAPEQRNKPIKLNTKGVSSGRWPVAEVNGILMNKDGPILEIDES